MSSEKYLNAAKKMNDRQRKIMGDLFMKGVNHDGHSWNTYGDVEDAVADLLETTTINVGMLSEKEAADAAILNMSEWDYETNGKYQLDEQNAKALVEEYIKLRTENEDYKKRSAANEFLGSLPC